MKNKKILARILALCSVLVLLISMSIPVFADEQSTQESPVYVIHKVEFTDFDTMFAWLKSNYQKVTSVSFVQPSDGVTYTASNVVYLYDPLYDSFIIGSSVVVPDLDDETFYFTLGLYYDSESGAQTHLIAGWTNNDPIVNLIVPASYWSDFGLRFTVNYMEELVTDGSATPIRSGFFGQLYYLLRDAIFGKDVVLDSAQDFTLTQISTWMTYIIILLPIIVIAIFLWRVFAR